MIDHVSIYVTDPAAAAPLYAKALAPLVFNAANKLTLESPRGDESRLMDVALVEVAGVVLVLVYVLRHHNEVRAISLRRASKQERKLYASWQETH